MEIAETTVVKAPVTEIDYLRKLAAEIPEANLQREMLAQLYLQNDRLKAIKTHLIFYTVLAVASIISVALYFGQ